MWKDKKLLLKGLNRSSISYSHFLPQKKSSQSKGDALEPVLDLDFFKNSLSLHYKQIYSSQKWKNWFYRFLFFGFTLLFLGLGLGIYFKTANFACGFYFKNCTTFKNCLNLMCFILAGGAFWIGYKTQPEKEAIQYVMNQVEGSFPHSGKNLQIKFNTIIANISPGNRCVHKFFEDNSHLR